MRCAPHTGRDVHLHTASTLYACRPTGPAISVPIWQFIRLRVRLSIHPSPPIDLAILRFSAALYNAQWICFFIVFSVSLHSFITLRVLTSLHPYLYTPRCIATHVRIYTRNCSHVHKNTVRQSGPDAVETYGRIMPRTRASDSRNLHRHEATCRSGA